MTKYKHVDQKEFDMIKKLHEGGLSVSMIAKAIKRSWIIVSKVVKAESFEAYKTPVTKAPAAKESMVDTLLEKIEKISELVDQIMAELKK